METIAKKEKETQGVETQKTRKPSTITMFKTMKSIYERMVEHEGFSEKEKETAKEVLATLKEKALGEL